VGGIYKICNIKDGTVYIGSAKDFVDREGRHFYNLTHNCHVNPHLQRAYTRDGRESFKFLIVEVIEPYDKLTYFARENHFIELHKTNGKVYNIAKAEGGWTHHTYLRKREIGKKISVARRKTLCAMSAEDRRKKYGHRRGTKLTEEEKINVSKKLKGVVRSPETREKMRLAKLGKPSKLKGVPKSEETKRKMSIAQLGHPVSDEAKAKMRAAKLRRRTL